MELTTTPEIEEVAMFALSQLRPEWVAAHRHQPERILAALGHPGYGRSFSRDVLAAMERYDLSVHDLIYGRRP